MNNKEYEQHISLSMRMYEKTVIRVPKLIAKIKICGGGLTFSIYDNMQFEMPTEEQRKNLSKFFGIEVEEIKE